MLSPTTAISEADCGALKRKCSFRSNLPPIKTIKIITRKITTTKTIMITLPLWPLLVRVS